MNFENYKHWTLDPDEDSQVMWEPDEDVPEEVPENPQSDQTEVPQETTGNQNTEDKETEENKEPEQNWVVASFHRFVYQLSLH